MQGSCEAFSVSVLLPCKKDCFVSAKAHGKSGGRSSTRTCQPRVDDTPFTDFKDKARRSMKALQIQFLTHFSVIAIFFPVCFVV